jgi:hypothetical protein
MDKGNASIWPTTGAAGRWCIAAAAREGQHVVLGHEARAKGRGRQAKRRTLRLPLEPFMGRWRLHVPPIAQHFRPRCHLFHAPEYREEMRKRFHTRQDITPLPTAIED